MFFKNKNKKTFVKIIYEKNFNNQGFFFVIKF